MKWFRGGAVTARSRDAASVVILHARLMPVEKY
jgi:hypothetical protein